MNRTEIIQRQNEIIRTQSEIIDDLFLLLMQHISVEEADRLPVVDKINHAAEICREIDY